MEQYEKVEKIGDGYLAEMNRALQDPLGKLKGMINTTYQLMICVNLENVAYFSPNAEKGYLFKVGCTNCDDISKTEVCLYMNEPADRPRGKGKKMKEIHLYKKCKFCGGIGTVRMIEEKKTPRITNSEPKSVMLFECDGIMPLEFQFGFGWTAVSLTGHPLSDVSFTCGKYEATDVDGAPVKIFNLHSWFKPME